MRSINNKIAGFLILLAAFAACKKPDLAGFDSTGEGLVPFSLQSPSSGTAVALNAATPNATVEFTWATSVPGLKTPPAYKWVAALKTGSLDTPLIAIPANNNGLDTKLFLRYQQLDSALKAKGIAAGAQTALIWSILADNGSTKLLAQNTYNLIVTRFQDGASPFVLLGPSSSTASMVINPGSTTDSLRFNWTRSSPSNAGNGLTYQVWFYKDSTTTPVFSATANNNGKDSTLSISYAAFADSLNAHGFTNVAQAAALKWTVAAISGGWTQWSSYTNQLYLVRQIDLFLAGSFQTPNSWDPPTGIQMIPDSRPALQNKMYWIYIYLPANTEFKFTQGRSWDVNFSGDGAGNLVPNGSTNLKVTNAGVYRISANLDTKKYDISTGRMGFVGGAVTNVDWNPPSVFPTAQMNFTGTNMFMGVYGFSTGPWKMIDGDHWNDGTNTPGEVRSYGSADGSSFVINGSDNMPDISSAGTYKVVWDGTDVMNPKYTIQSWHMYLIGDATAGGWDNASPDLPELTYEGNGIWKITGVPLTGGKAFKFLMVKGTWDYNYGGTEGDTSPMAGTAREGGGNILVTASGTYTVTIDEYNHTYKAE